MEALANASSWFGFGLAVLTFAVGFTRWVSKSQEQTRHALRGEIQKVAGDADNDLRAAITMLRTEDKDSEARVNRQIDGFWKVVESKSSNVRRGGD
jgi:hypothetical protein